MKEHARLNVFVAFWEISAGNVSNPLLRVHHCSQIASIFGKKGDKKEKMNE